MDYSHSYLTKDQLDDICRFVYEYLSKKGATLNTWVPLDSFIGNALLIKYKSVEYVVYIISKPGKIIGIEICETKKFNSIMCNTFIKYDHDYKEILSNLMDILG